MFYLHGPDVREQLAIACVVLVKIGVTSNSWLQFYFSITYSVSFLCNGSFFYFSCQLNKPFVFHFCRKKARNIINVCVFFIIWSLLPILIQRQQILSGMHGVHVFFKLSFHTLDVF